MRAQNDPSSSAEVANSLISSITINNPNNAEQAKLARVMNSSACESIEKSTKIANKRKSRATGTGTGKRKLKSQLKQTKFNNMKASTAETSAMNNGVSNNSEIMDDDSKVSGGSDVEILPPDPMNKWQCKYCGASYTKRQNLYRHMAKKHPEDGSLFDKIPRGQPIILPALHPIKAEPDYEGLFIKEYEHQIIEEIKGLPFHAHRAMKQLHTFDYSSQRLIREFLMPGLDDQRRKMLKLFGMHKKFVAETIGNLYDTAVKKINDRVGPLELLVAQMYEALKAKGIKATVDTEKESSLDESLKKDILDYDSALNLTKNLYLDMYRQDIIFDRQQAHLNQLTAEFDRMRNKIKDYEHKFVAQEWKSTLAFQGVTDKLLKVQKENEVLKEEIRAMKEEAKTYQKNVIIGNNNTLIVQEQPVKGVTTLQSSIDDITKHDISKSNEKTVSLPSTAIECVKMTDSKVYNAEGNANELVDLNGYPKKKHKEQVYLNSELQEMYECEGTHEIELRDKPLPFIPEPPLQKMSKPLHQTEKILTPEERAMLKRVDALRKPKAFYYYNRDHPISELCRREPSPGTKTQLSKTT